MAGKRIGLVLSGGNVDREVFAPIIARGGERDSEGGRP